MLKFFVLSIATTLILAGCASNSPKTSEIEEPLVPNWDTHARDEEIMKNGAPVSGAKSAQTAVNNKSELELEVQQFATINYTLLGRDLKAGKGKTLSELLQILRIPGKEQSSAIRRIKSLYEGSPNPTLFSENLWSWYARR